MKNTLKPALALWKQRLAATLAEASGARWDIVATRVCGVLSLLAGAGLYAHWIPGKPGAVVAGASGAAAALLPRATKAAGLLSAAYGQKTPFLKVVPQLVSVLLSGPSIVAEVKAEQQKRAEAEKQQATQQTIDQAVEKKLASLTFEDLAGMTGEFARAQLGKKEPAPAEEEAPVLSGDKAPDVPKDAEAPRPAAETLPEAQTGISAPNADPALRSDPAITLVGGNQ